MYQPGIYPQVLTLSGSQSLAPVTAAKPAYVLCNGISGSSSVRSSGVFLYVVNGGVTGQLSLSAPTSGTFQSIALWIKPATTWNIGDVNIEGAVYGPLTDISMGGNSSLTVSVLIVHSISLSGNPDLAVTGTGTPRSPILTAQTGTILRTVNLSWTPQQFPGITITGYELSADRGTRLRPLDHDPWRRCDDDLGRRVRLGGQRRHDLQVPGARAQRGRRRQSEQHRHRRLLRRHRRSDGHGDRAGGGRDRRRHHHLHRNGEQRSDRRHDHHRPGVRRHRMRGGHRGGRTGPDDAHRDDVVRRFASDDRRRPVGVRVPVGHGRQHRDGVRHGTSRWTPRAPRSPA